MTLGIAGGLFISCERHDFAETKKLQESHGAPGAAHATAEGADHGVAHEKDAAPKAEAGKDAAKDEAKPTP